MKTLTNKLFPCQTISFSFFNIFIKFILCSIGPTDVMYPTCHYNRSTHQSTVRVPYERDQGPQQLCGNVDWSFIRYVMLLTKLWNSWKLLKQLLLVFASEHICILFLLLSYSDLFSYGNRHHITREKIKYMTHLFYMISSGVNITLPSTIFTIDRKYCFKSTKTRYNIKF